MSTDSDRSPTYVVGIGASAGGLDALEKFFHAMPVDTGLAYVIVQHLSPDFKSLMDELLSRHTTMPIHRVEDATPIEANAIYLIPPRMNLTVSGRRLMLTEQDHERGLNLPIDLFFKSLAREFGSLAIAVILSGTGSDGSRGIQDIKTAGGMVAVQSVEDAAFDGMPRNAIATSIVDVVDTAERIPARIVEYVGSPGTFQTTAEQLDFSEHGEMGEVMKLFRTRFGLDFSYYKSPTISRRLERRITMTGKKSLKEYIEFLREDAHEVETLYRDLLVEVTRFFRDQEAFVRMRDEVIPEIVAGVPDHGSIRVWVPACATGEEAYSFAMLLAEEQRRATKTFSYKVFATDVHPASLELASTGVYSDEAVSHVPADLRSRYFRFSGGLHHITKEIRQRVIFAPHDITRDPPFTKLDLISCRNVLIYLESKIQRKALSLFHFGLKVDGILFLGPSEAVADLTNEFETVDAHWRIFRKLRDVRLSEGGAFNASAPLSRPVPWRPSYVSTATRADNGWLVPEVYEDLLAKYVPPSLLVNDQHELVHCFGTARKLLVQPEGRPTMDVLRLTDGPLRTALSAALHRAKTKRETVVFKSVRLEVDGMEQNLRVVVEPYDKGSEKLLLVCLEETEPRRPVEYDETDAEEINTDDTNMARMATLERELLYTKESLQATVEELETSNEELQATNEELVAANEELQSTNEELHSVNEELYTVNAEHQRKIDELTDLTNDMDNLLRSTEIGTIFLDREMCIRKYTPAIAEAFHVMPQDIGRPIDHIAYRFDDANLLDTVQQVLESEVPSERTVHNNAGTPFLERMQPYRTAEGVVDGVVLTFVDVSKVREAETAREFVERRLEAISDNLTVMICYVDRDVRVQYANRAYAARFGLDADALVGSPLQDLVGAEVYGRKRSHLQRALSGETVSFEHRIVNHDNTSLWTLAELVPDRRKDGKVVGVYCSLVDITERRRADANARRLADIVRTSDQAIIGFDAEWVVNVINPAAESLLGYGAGEATGRRFSFLHPARSFEPFAEAMEQIRLGNPFTLDSEAQRKDGARIWIETSFSPVFDAEGTIVGGSAIMRSGSRNPREALLEQIVEQAPCALVMVAPNGLIGNTNELLEHYFGYTREELIGRPVEVLIPEGLREQHVELREGFMEAPVKREMGQGKSLFGLRKDGTEFPIQVGLTPIRGEQRTYILAAIFNTADRGLPQSSQSADNAVDE